MVTSFGDTGGGLNKMEEGIFVAVSLVLTFGNSPYGVTSRQPCLGTV